jgi:2,3-bisphosphoglycerate-independent phosphoglycerate mutase
MDRFCAELERVGIGRVASVSGRYYAMDRDRRWDRTQSAYEVIAGNGNGTADDPVAYINAQYAAGVTDEFLPTVSILHDGERIRVDDGDSIIFFNFRPDRARQLTHALLDRHFDGFARSRIPDDIAMTTFTEYERDLAAEVAFRREDVRETLAEEVSEAGVRQFHVAETEKYAHVTYFINGGREDPFPGERRLLIASPKVATYDTVPAMSAEAVANAVVNDVEEGGDGLIVVNFANPDMVGHTGDFSATVQAVEFVDAMMGRVARAVLDAGGAMLMTADHGNAEHKIDPTDGSPLTAHTTSAVPLLLCGTTAVTLRAEGGLRDVAPTVLATMGLPVPEVMTGTSLVET